MKRTGKKIIWTVFVCFVLVIFFFGERVYASGPVREIGNAVGGIFGGGGSGNSGTGIHLGSGGISANIGLPGVGGINVSPNGVGVNARLPGVGGVNWNSNSGFNVSANTPLGNVGWSESGGFRANANTPLGNLRWSESGGFRGNTNIGGFPVNLSQQGANFGLPGNLGSFQIPFNSFSPSGGFNPSFYSGSAQTGNVNQLPSNCTVLNGQIYCSTTGTNLQPTQNVTGLNNLSNCYQDPLSGQIICGYQQPSAFQQAASPQGVGWVPDPNNPLGLPAGISLPPGVGGPYYVDSCINQNADYSNPVVMIAGQTLKSMACADSNTLKVLACYNANTAFSLDVPCPGGCSNDTCVNAVGQQIRNPVSTSNWQSGSPVCMDSDGGYNLEKKGYVNQPGYSWDECRSGEQIIENMCDAFGLPVRYVDSCQFGCSDGACLPAPGESETATIEYIQCGQDYTCEEGYRAYISSVSGSGLIPDCVCVPDVGAAEPTSAAGGVAAVTAEENPAAYENCDAVWSFENGFNVITTDKIFVADPVLDAGMTMYDFIWDGKQRWRVSGEERFYRFVPGIGYYVYNPGMPKDICMSYGGGDVEDIIVRRGWNFLANTGSEDVKLSDIHLYVINEGAQNNCANRGCSSPTTLRQLLVGSGETRRLYSKIYLIADPRSSDPKEAFETISLTADNIDSIKIPPVAYWIYLFE